MSPLLMYRHNRKSGYVFTTLVLLVIWSAFGPVDCLGQARDRSVFEWLSLFEVAKASGSESRLQGIVRQSDQFQIQAWHAELLDLPFKQQRLVLQLYEHMAKEEPAGNWDTHLGLAAWTLQVTLPDSLRPIMRRIIRRSPQKVPVECWELYLADTLRLRYDPYELLEEATWLEQGLRKREIYQPENQQEVDRLRSMVLDPLTEFLTDCDSLVEVYKPALTRAFLPPQKARVFMLGNYLLGCQMNTLQDSLVEVALTYSPDTYFLRLAALREEQRGEYLKAVELRRKCLRIEPSDLMKAHDEVKLVWLYQQLGEFRTARIAGEAALKLAPNRGEAYFALADLILASAPVCNFSPFERKALYWLAIDYCEKAVMREPRLEKEAAARISQYRKLMPTRAEVQFHNLQTGDSFPLGCWMNVAVRVR
ncbi:MAG: hypothetical protein AAGI38_19580 [Bacteroidota bacterium]